MRLLLASIFTLFSCVSASAKTQLQPAHFEPSFAEWGDEKYPCYRNDGGDSSTIVSSVYVCDDPPGDSPWLVLNATLDDGTSAFCVLDADSYSGLEKRQCEADAEEMNHIRKALRDSQR